MPCPKCILGYCLSHSEPKFAHLYLKCISCGFTVKAQPIGKLIALQDEEGDVG